MIRRLALAVLTVAGLLMAPAGGADECHWILGPEGPPICFEDAGNVLLTTSTGELLTTSTGELLTP